MKELFESTSIIGFGIAYRADQVNRFVAEANAALAAERHANTELAMRERKAEADLADANHALMLANNSADAFRRVAEQRQGEIERLQRVIEEHNQACVSECLARPHGHCTPYLSRGRDCPDCPKYNRIEVAQ